MKFKDIVYCDFLILVKDEMLNCLKNDVKSGDYENAFYH